MNADGTAALASGGNGITIDGLNNTVGGTGAGAGNIIAFNDNDGVFVGGHDSGNAIRHNSIFADAHLGSQTSLLFRIGTVIALNFSTQW
jgi:hypothetical protein